MIPCVVITLHVCMSSCLFSLFLFISSATLRLLVFFFFFVFFQAEDGIRDLVRSRGLGDVYKRQDQGRASLLARVFPPEAVHGVPNEHGRNIQRVRSFPAVAGMYYCCLLYTSDAADERSSVDLGGRRIIKKKKRNNT